MKISLDNDPAHKYIQYTYSYDGTLLKKTVKNGSKLDTYIYINGFTYKSSSLSGGGQVGADTLQYFMQSEGRVRYTKEQDANGDYTGNYFFVYDYFISDHLGNVRTVLTEQQLVNKYPAATLEDSRVAAEKNYYDIDDGRRVAKSLTGAIQSSFENKLYRTNAGNNEKIGLGITLKVMAGDEVFIKAESFYQQPGGSGVGNPLPIILTELANAFIGTPIIASSGKGITAGTITNNTPSANSLSDFLNNNRTPPNAQTPRAYLNWVLFDDQFQFVAGGTDPVNPSGGYKLHDAFITNPVQITKNGYLFVYCSNESDLNVFFDNLQLTHVQGHLLQEDTYYPFGMGIMALSSKAASGLQNGYKYNGISEEDNFDLDLYDAYYRTLDPQLGRWWQTDPYNEFASPYLSMGNNPVNYTDPGGGFLFDGWGQFLSSSIGFFGGAAAGYFIAKNNGGNPATGALFGAIGGGAAGYFGYGLATNVNWGNIAGIFGNAGSWAGQQIGSVFGNGSLPNSLIYSIYQRSFAPWDKFGRLGNKVFHGDNRNFSLDINASSRIWGAFKVDISNGTLVGNTLKGAGVTKSYDLNGNQTGENLAIPSFKIAGPRLSGNITRLNTYLSGSNPLVSLADPIVWNASIAIANNVSKGYIDVGFGLYGKAFPAYESFIMDAKGNKAFLNVFQAPDKKYAISRLMGSAFQTQSNISIRFYVNRKGNFTGKLFFNGRKYTFPQWNNWIRSLPASVDK